MLLSNYLSLQEKQNKTKKNKCKKLLQGCFCLRFGLYTVGETMLNSKVIWWGVWTWSKVKSLYLEMKAMSAVAFLLPNCSKVW